MFSVLRQYALTFLACIGLAGMSIPAAASSAWNTVYVYAKPDGGHLLTSQRVRKKGYRLVKKYKTRKKTKKQKSTSSRKKTGKKVKALKCKGMSVRAKQHKRAVEVYSRVYGVEEELVHAIIKNESCYQKTARSPVGAIGLMQLMPDTAKDMKISNPWNPEQNIQGGVRYISEMLDQFNGNKKLALAAYNAGPGKVRKYKGIPPYRETRTYVKRVMQDYENNKKKTGVRLSSNP